MFGYKDVEIIKNNFSSRRSRVRTRSVIIITIIISTGKQQQRRRGHQ